MIGQVETIGKGGEGIVRVQGRAVFIPLTAPGDVVEFDLERPAAGRGRLLRIVQPSPRRQEPPCPYYAACGGCNLQHIAYPEQLRVKQQILTDNLRRIARLPVEQIPEIIPSPPFRYRSKCELQIRNGRGGFFRRRSHELVDIGSCLLLPQDMERTLLQLKKRAAVTDGTLTMLGNGSESRWLWQGTGLAVDAAAAAPLAFHVGEFAYSVTPAAFIQSNLFLLETMQRLLTEYLQPRRFASAADLFCGAGFFTLPLSRFCRLVQALENDPPNLLSLRANLKANRAENVSVLERDLYRSEIPGAEIYVLDPPRQGITKSVIDKVAAHRPRSVVCFACDSATFARDLALFLKRGFTLSRLQLLDNFPQTDHLEIFAVLERG